MRYLGIDLGGTTISAAVVTEEGQILSRSQLDTPRGAEPVCDAVAAAARQAAAAAGCTPEALDGAGIGSPGTIDPQAGVVEYWSNLDFRHVPLVPMLEQRLGRPILLENDANTAALGEYTAGAGRGAGSMVAVTLGTGIGGGAVLGGRLYTGANHAALEVGHMVIDRTGGPLCTCGRRGCFESLASASALVRQARRAMEGQRDSLLWSLVSAPEQVNGKVFFAALDQGDPTARSVMEQYIQYLGCGIINLINIFQPEVLCIGGGISQAGRALLDPLQALLDREEYTRDNPRRTRLVLARLGNDAGLIGAALLSRFR